MFSVYELLVFIHVAGACVWFGGGVTMEVMGLRLGSSPDKERMTQFFDIAHYVSPRIFMPAAIVTLLSGITLVLQGGADFQDHWIIVALVGVALTLVIGATQIGPNVGKIKSLLESGAPQAEVNRIGRRLNFVTRVDLAILLLVLLDMVLKPQF